MTADGTSRWYKDAVIYQTHIRAFCDLNNDGIGDFTGLTSKLDYVRDLGVTAIWLLPFYPSPLRDDGYDIAHYTDVNPIYGTLQDFKQFLHEAHERGLKVITELVLNHTSDKHEWFQRSRRAQPGDKYRDYYVWSDTKERYREARIIFQDYEVSNWTWDPIANAYYWHRFYSHQPDLNFDNPDVHRSMIEVLDFWLKLGVDGLRLDAVPYLYERDGTSCENLPETHEFLKKLRKHVDDNFEDRLLLAEANQWPEDAVAYFGNDDECHMAFHFPLMPRLFMAVQQEDRYPIVDILRQTPQIPEGCQWSMFLRNHDELTLEMVTDEERDYMYRAYAKDPKSRINLGIRRRLAPLLGNNRRKIELMNGLLFSFPGTPIIYYGDELGMGDNIYLGDRDGVRTPMQWSADRNAGFSRANPQSLYLPVITDPEFHFTALNVETEQNSSHSLLWWMKRLIALRKHHRAFGRGTIEFLTPENSKVLAFLRRYENETVLVVGNLSRYAQCSDVDLSAFKGMEPFELFGQTKFPAIDDRPYRFVLGPYDFYWFSLQHSLESMHGPSVEELPTLRVSQNWSNLFKGYARDELEEALPDFLHRQKWFPGERFIREVEIDDAFPIHPADESAPYRILLLTAFFGEGEPEQYCVPLAYLEREAAERLLSENPIAAVAHVEVSGSDAGLLCDAAKVPAFWSAFLQIIVQNLWTGQLAGTQTAGLETLLSSSEPMPSPAPLKSDHHNSSAVFGEKLILKMFRKIDAGINPDLEIGRFITERAAYPHTPLVAGAIEYPARRDDAKTLAILHEYKTETISAWDLTVDQLGRFFERAFGEYSLESLTPELTPRCSPAEVAQAAIPPVVMEMIGAFMNSAELLGRRTAEMHIALSSDNVDPKFAPEPFTPFYQRGLYQSLRNLTQKAMSALRYAMHRLPEETRPAAKTVIGLEGELLKRFEAVSLKKIASVRIRTHGDFHLAQVLFTGRDFIIIDFEGESARSINDRRIKRSSFRDVADMLRSFHYASNVGFFSEVKGYSIRPEDRERGLKWSRFWYTWVSAAFVRSYTAHTVASSLIPKDPKQIVALLETFVIEQALQEVISESISRPSLVGIPVSGILELLDQS